MNASFGGANPCSAKSVRPWILLRTISGTSSFDHPSTVLPSMAQIGSLRAPASYCASVRISRPAGVETWDVCSWDGGPWLLQSSYATELYQMDFAITRFGRHP